MLMLLPVALASFVHYLRPARIRDARGAGNSRRRLAGNFSVVDVYRQRLAFPA